MNKRYSLIFKKCQFLICFLICLTVNNAQGNTSNTNFICGYKNMVEYINSLISLDRQVAISYIKKLKKNTITPSQLKRLVTILMRYRLLPIANTKRCRFFNYMCVPINNTDAINNFADTYLQKNPQGPTKCYIISNHKVVTQNLFSKYCTLVIKTRIRAIPTPLSIAQAALESNWGTSRLVQKGNNFYGIQNLYSSSRPVQNNSKCFSAQINKKNCIYYFDSIETNLFIYSQLLNSHPAYIQARALRYQSEYKNNHICTTAKQMATGLKHYATDHQYIIKIKHMIDSICNTINKC